MRPILLIILSLGCCASLRASVTIDDLRCEHQTNPLGIDTHVPCLSWILESNQRNETQTAYEVMASSSPDKLAKGDFDELDSGKVLSDESINIAYAGKPLTTGQRVWWKVRVWDVNGKVSEFSKSAWFEMALLEPSDWQAKWIQRRSDEADPESQAFDDHPAPCFERNSCSPKKSPGLVFT